MSAASTTAAPASHPDPSPDRAAAGAEAPSRTVRLLGLVRKLIDYGKELASALQQRTAATDLTTVSLCFGTIDIALILSLITRGLHRAAALEARLVDLALRPEATRPAAGAPSRHRPRAAQPAVPGTSTADPRLARLPTPRDIAAQVRRRPIGAVIADICRDLGIVCSHPLWRELSNAVVENDGNLTTLLQNVFKRGLAIHPRRLATQRPIPPGVARPTAPAPQAPSVAAFGTGPP